MVAPIPVVLVGNKKLDPTTLPLVHRAPVKADESTLLNELLLHVPPTFQEFPVEVTVLARLVATALLAAILEVNVAGILNMNPVPRLFQAVLRVNFIAPG